MNRQRASQFVNDLYRDLRDRRLLIPAIALLVAIVAVPMLIGGDSEAVPPAPAASAFADAEGEQVNPAVLTTDPGVRNYRQRLARLKERNPFVQKFTLPKAKDVELNSVGGDTGSTTAGGGTGGGSTSSDTTITDTVTDTTSSSSAGTTDTVTDTSTETTDTTNTTQSSPDSGNRHQTKPETRFYAGRVDVALGPLGEVEKYRDVRYLDFLPSTKNPLATFVSLDGRGGAAVFSLSRDIVETSGDGSCAPHESEGCELLRLKVGEQRMLKLASGKTYRLKLLDTNLVRIPDPRHGGKSSDSPTGG